jgi:UDP-2-acetamido-3-amino-2,3-dideoxy-glucuronate N-acetyltransferase
MVYGNPAQHKGWVSEYGHKLTFNDEQIAFCSETNQKYILEDSIVKRLT